MGEEIFDFLFDNQFAVEDVLGEAVGESLKAQLHRLLFAPYLPGGFYPTYLNYSQTFYALPMNDLQVD
jgi:hypothetical protein